MSLHDQIMSMCAPDNVVSHPLCMGGYSVAQQRAAQIAKEADELMAEMAETMKQYDTEACRDEFGEILQKYNDWKERTQ